MNRIIWVLAGIRWQKVNIGLIPSFHAAFTFCLAKTNKNESERRQRMQRECISSVLSSLLIDLHKQRLFFDEQMLHIQTIKVNPLIIRHVLYYYYLL